MHLTLPHARQDGGALGSVKEQGPRLRSALVRSRAQVRASTAPSLFLPFLPSSRNSGNSEDNVNTFLLCASTSCFRGWGYRRSSWSPPRCQWYGAGLLSPHRPRRAAACAGDATRACCTPAISGTRRSPPREKTSSLFFRTSFSSVETQK